MNVLGSDPKQVTKETVRDVNSPAWSADGEYIFVRKHFVFSRSLGAGEIWMYHHTGGTGLQVTDRPNEQQDQGEPYASPDGTWVYYSQDVTQGPLFQYNKDTNPGIYAVLRRNLETGEQETVTRRPGGSVTPTPHADGRRLAFVRRVRTSTVLFIRDMETGEEWPVWDGLERDMQEAWAIHGVYTRFDWIPGTDDVAIWAQGKLWRVNTATGDAARIPFTAQVDQRVQQVVRPTGLLDPEPEVRPATHQVDDLLSEVKKRVAQEERVLVTTLTKRMAEDLADYLADLGFQVHYLHSEIQTLERVEILRDLRLGVYDVVVGINLLREGLDLPEVSLVAILDADKEGYLRSEGALIQTMGRAARHVDGRVVMYADTMTESMRRAIEETNRRRRIQTSYNQEHGIQPEGIRKAIRDLTDRVRKVAEERAVYRTGPIPKDEIARLIKELESQMKAAAKNLEFERAALLRDQIVELRRELVGDEEGLKELSIMRRRGW